MTQAYAGAVAEALFFSEDPFAVWDRQRCDQNRVSKTVALLRSKNYAEPIVKKCRWEAWIEANRLVENRKPSVEAIADPLCQSRRLTRIEAEKLARQVDQSPFQHG